MPTTNPVPSTDPSDLLFNAGKLDEVVNGAANSFTDRLGVARRTVAGMNADFDAQLADAESDLNVYRADAAASAAEALGYLQTMRATSYGAYSSDPATDPLGNPPTVGDEYFNTTANLLKRWNGTTWQASDINTANLAAPSGSSLVGYDTGTVQDVLDDAKPLQSYTALRNYTGRATGVRITTPGIAGFFQRTTDTTSADNGGVIIVDGAGRRWKRLYVGAIYVSWFGALGNGAEAAPQIQAAINYADSLGGGEVIIPQGDYLISTALQTKSRVIISGNGKDTILNVGANNCFSFGTVTFVDIKSLKIIGVNAATSGHGFSFESGLASTIYITDVEIKNMDSAIKYQAGNITVHIVVDGCYFSYNRNWHILIDANAELGSVAYYNTRFEQNGQGVGAFKSVGSPKVMAATDFVNCIFEGQRSQYAVDLGQNVFGANFISCHFEANASDGGTNIPVADGADVYIGGGTGNVQFIGCMLSKPNILATNFHQIRCATSLQKIVVKSCMVFGSDQDGYSGLIYYPGAGSKNVLLDSNFYSHPTIAGDPTKTELVKNFNYLKNLGTASRVNDYSNERVGLRFGPVVKTMTTTDATTSTLWGGLAYLIELNRVNGMLITAEVQCVDATGAVYGMWVLRKLITTNATQTITSRGDANETAVTSGGTLNCTFAINANGLESANMSLNVTGVASATIKWIANVSVMQLSH